MNTIVRCVLFPFVGVAMGTIFHGPARAQEGWSEITLPAANQSLSVISFSDTVHGCICGRDGLFLYTSDNGQTWRADTIPSPYGIVDCKVVSDSVIWAWSHASQQQWAIYRSGDCGISWIPRNPPDSFKVKGVGFASDNVAWAATTARVWITTDAGQSWLPRGQLLSPDSSFLDDSWEANTIEFADDSLGFIYGRGGLISDLWPQMTTDGGWTWTSWPPASGLGGILYGGGPVRFLKGGIWTFDRFWHDEMLNHRLDELILTWNGLHDSVRLGPWGRFTEVLKGFALDRQHIWLLINNRLQRTTNGGITWMADSFAVILNELLYDSFGHRFALGRGRLFQLTTPDEVADHPREPVPTYHLAQNFPNPFNSSTTITYHIRHQGRVTLKVFDLLGRHITTLVDKVEQPGSYAIRVDAAHWSSGVYVYRLEAGGFRQARSFILLR
jgi:hypothetical protein